MKYWLDFMIVMNVYEKKFEMILQDGWNDDYDG